MLIVDGHNLVPKIPGMSLSEVDDEQRLVALLQIYAQARRKKIEVYFDGAPPGQAGERAFGLVRAHFVPAAQKADDAIQRRLARMGKAARNVTVVSSDNRVQIDARALHASVLSSEDFARELLEVDVRASKKRGKTGPKPAGGDQAGLPPQEIIEWLNVFGIDPQKADQPLVPVQTARRKKTKDGTPAPVNPAAPKPPKKERPRAHHGFPRKS